MKTKSIAQSLAGHWMKSVALGMALALLAAAHQARAASAAELLEKGIYTEETKGELKAAIQVYQQIAEDPQADRSLVAQAQLRLGLCQLKLGNKPQAFSALDRLTREFPDADKLLALVEQQMPQLLDEILRHIERNYIEEVDRSELMETALRAIVGKLDSRGSLLRTNDMEFLSASEVKQMKESIDQEIVGVGAILNAKDGEVFVVQPMAGSPAFDGGLRSGDRIVTIDGAMLPANELATAVRLLRGPVGSQVTIGVKRAEAQEPLEITLVRNVIRVPSITGNRRRPDNTWDFMLDDQNKIGYVRLSQLGKQSAEEMQDALEGLEARGLRALVFDLRNNPGGTLDGAVAVADLFVERGRIVTVKGRSGETAYEAKADGTFTAFPIALLVNRNTASAAEIVAACLQDHHRAVVVGERTFGQGIVRSLFQLKGGVGAVKLPIAAYYRPSGRSVNRYPDSKDSDDWGITPDAGYVVMFTEAELKQYGQDRAARATSFDAAGKTQFEDRQLQKALECIQAQLGNK